MGGQNKLQRSKKMNKIDPEIGKNNCWARSRYVVSSVIVEQTQTFRFDNSDINFQGEPEVRNLQKYNLFRYSALLWSFACLSPFIFNSKPLLPHPLLKVSITSFMIVRRYHDDAYNPNIRRLVSKSQRPEDLYSDFIFLFNMSDKI